MGNLITRIRQKLCRHRFAMSQIKTRHDEEYYYFTYVCAKCGRNFVAKFSRDLIDTWESEAKNP